LRGPETNFAPPLIGAPSALKITEPLRLGDHEHARTILGEVPLVALLIHPGIRLPSTRKVIFEGDETFAEIVIAVLKMAKVEPPVREKELNTIDAGSDVTKYT
jgi:hypothetical protein